MNSEKVLGKACPSAAFLPAATLAVVLLGKPDGFSQRRFGLGTRGGCDFMVALLASNHS